MVVNYCGLLGCALQASRTECICPSIEFTHYIRIHSGGYEPPNQQRDYAQYLRQVLQEHQYIFQQ
jgi:hypothetical protein